MGLDMYLVGAKYPKKDYNNPENNKTIDGFEVSAINLRLGYWRKHPNLHGYIVNTFANGEDNCQLIYIGKDGINQIIDAVEHNNLPHTTGFFFGKSADINSLSPEEREWARKEKEYTLEILRKAAEWLNEPSDEYYKDVLYEASW